MFLYKGCENIKKININKNKLKIIIILGIAFVIFFSGYCFAKYNISKKTSANSKIAVPVLEVEGTETTKISAINNIGYYDFKIKNYNEKNISDVSQNYSIEIIANTDDSISFELYNEDEEVTLTNNKTDNIYIEGTKEKEHSYRLKVTYDKTKSNAEKDILEDVQIKVHSEQTKM